MAYDKPLRICRLFRRTSKAGSEYFSGVMNGGVSVVLFKAKGPDAQPDEWEMFFSAREQQPGATTTPKQRQDSQAPAAASASAGQLPLGTPKPKPVDELPARPSKPVFVNDLEDEIPF